MTKETDTRMASRRAFLRTGAVGGAAALAAPHIATAQGQTTKWRVQTSWPGGVGLKIFEDWCTSIKEKTGGELEFEPFGAKDVVGDFQLYDAVKNGVLEAVNPFTIYAQGIIPAAMFLTSYPLGLRNPHEFDTFYYGLGGLELARELYARQNMHFVGPIHHGPNIIHSKVPILSIDDFKGRKMRLPGGMVAEVFQDAGAKTTLLPGSEIFPALDKGTIDVADYVGPAINYALGFHKATKYISMGPPGFMSIYQPVDLMALTVGVDHWKSQRASTGERFTQLSGPKQQAWVGLQSTTARITKSPVTPSAHEFSQPPGTALIPFRPFWQPLVSVTTLGPSPGGLLRNLKDTTNTSFVVTETLSGIV